MTHQKIAVIDYEMGNLRSVLRAFESVNADVVVTRGKKAIQDATKLVLPGVGAYKHCMETLKKHNLIDVIKSEIHKGKPFLGVCLGFQLLFDESEENQGTKGLGILRGTVKRFDFSQGLKVPHMGWNSVTFNSRFKIQNSNLFNGIKNQSDFYFAHSFYVQPADPSVIAATAEYGITFPAAVCRDNVFACQFHPEKSQENGLKVISNFCAL